MGPEDRFELVPLNWRTPAGDATAMGFGDAGELVAAAVAAAEATFTAGDEQQRDTASRRLTSIVRRLLETSDERSALARAIRRWALGEEAARLVVLLLAIELSASALAQAMRVAGDPIRPGLTVEAAARVFGGDARGAATILRLLAPGGALTELAIVALAYPDLPFTRRILSLAPRVVDLALGGAPHDPTTGAWLVPPLASAANQPARTSVRTVLDVRPAVGIVRGLGGRAGLRVLSRVLADLGRPLLAIDLSLAADDGRTRALVRDALYLGAALVFVVDLTGRDLGRSARALDRIALQVPVFVAGGHGELAPPVAGGLVEVTLREPAGDELAAAIRAAFEGILSPAEMAEVIASAPCELAAVMRAADVLRGRELPASRVELVVRTIAEQVIGLDGGMATPAPLELPPLPDALADEVRAVARLWLESPFPRRLRVLVAGRPGLGKTTVAAAVASALRLPAYVLDARYLQHESIAAMLAAVRVGAAVLVLENLELGRGGRPGDPTIHGWLARCDGLIVTTTREQLSVIDATARREFDVALEVAMPSEDEQARMWQWHLARRGMAPPAELTALVKQFPMTPAQIERFVALRDPADPRAALERRPPAATGTRLLDLF